MKVIMLTSYQQCGKTTIAKLIKEELEEKVFDVKEVVLSEPVKRLLQKSLKIDEYELDRMKVDESFKIKIGSEETTMRNILINTAEFCKELFGKEVWIKYAIKNADKNTDYLLIPDLRLKEEYEYVKKKFKNNLIIIRINSNLETCKKSRVENFVDEVKPDFIIENNYDKNRDCMYKSLRKKIRKILKEIK